jgi:hypothetical protein
VIAIRGRDELQAAIAAVTIAAANSSAACAKWRTPC